MKVKTISSISYSFMSLGLFEAGTDAEGTE